MDGGVRSEVLRLERVAAEAKAAASRPRLQQPRSGSAPAELAGSPAAPAARRPLHKQSHLPDTPGGRVVPLTRSGSRELPPNSQPSRAASRDASLPSRASSASRELLGAPSRAGSREQLAAPRSPQKRASRPRMEAEPPSRASSAGGLPSRAPSGSRAPPSRVPSSTGAPSRTPSGASAGGRRAAAAEEVRSQRQHVSHSAADLPPAGLRE